MLNLNYCETIYDAQKLFVDVLNDNGAVSLFGHDIMPARLLYASMPDVFARMFHDFIAELVAKDFAPKAAIRWSLWDTVGSHARTSYPDYNVIMRGSQMRSSPQASLCVH